MARLQWIRLLVIFFDRQLAHKTSECMSRRAFLGMAARSPRVILLLLLPRSLLATVTAAREPASPKSNADKGRRGGLRNRGFSPSERRRDADRA
jgi:hypothetical protein